MNKKREPFPLERIIKGCTDRNSLDWEWAWRYLFSYYREYIYKIIFDTCAAYARYFTRDKDQIIQDIFAEFCYTLCKSESRVLKSFRAIESENAFRFYLGVITKRVARNILLKQGIPLKPEHLKMMENELEDDRFLWELHEHLVFSIRKVHKKKDKNLERNILLFTLYNLEGYTSEMIAKQPLFKELGSRVVDNVVFRIKSKLSNLEDFRE